MNESTEDQSVELVGNELIEQLMFSAGCTKQYFIDQRGNESNEYLINSDRLRNFADLIVIECIAVAIKLKDQVESQQVFNEHDKVWNKARVQQSQHIIDEIKKHFGVYK